MLYKKLLLGECPSLIAQYIGVYSFIQLLSSYMLDYIKIAMVWSDFHTGKGIDS